MNKIPYENAFPAVPPMVHARVSDTLKEIKTMKRTKPVAAILLTAAVVALFTGVAYAAVQSGVLDFLFKNKEPSQQQVEMVQELDLIHESDGVTTTLTDAVFDGRELSLGLTFQADRNVFTVINSVTINGIDAYRTNDNLGDMWLYPPFSDGDGEYAKGLTATIDKEYMDSDMHAQLDWMYEQIAINGQADISVSLSLLVPRQSIVPVDTYAEDTAAMWQAIDAAIAAGDTPVALDEPYEMLIGSAALGDEFDDSLPSQHILDSASTFMAYANAATLDRFTLDFTLDVDADLTDTEQGLALNPPIDIGSVHVVYDTVRTTPLSTDIVLSITPGDDQITNADIEEIYRYFSWFGYSGDTAMELRTSSSGGSTFEAQPDGSEVFKLSVCIGPLTDQPEMIRIVPLIDPVDENELLWEYAIPVYLPQE
ncbi:MAG TPA: DUF4179 domain-containing protein [Candidatus Limiplasma sp.]|mgnify:CR=1 FL=1|nr:DUF4179 domain-containing protein [Candidatus Limiplasma sp.]